MAISCVCPNGHVLRVKDQMAGKKGACPKCGAKFVVTPMDAPPAGALPSGQPEPAPTPAEPSAEPPAPAVEWRFAVPGGEPSAPASPEAFAVWLRSGEATPDTLVWRTGWEDWRRADDPAAELPAELPAAPPLGEPQPLPAETDPETPLSGDSIKPSTPLREDKANVYARKRRERAQRRRLLTILLAMVCLLLAGLLVWLSIAGPLQEAPT